MMEEVIKSEEVKEKPDRMYYQIILDGKTKNLDSLEEALQYIQKRFTKTSFCTLRIYNEINIITEKGFCFFPKTRKKEDDKPWMQ